MALFTSKTSAAARAKAKPQAKKPAPKAKSDTDGHEHLLASKHFGKETQARDPAGKTSAPKKNDGLATMVDGASKGMIGKR